MKILNVNEKMNPTFGGSEERTYQISRYVGLAGIHIDILTTQWGLDTEWVSTLPGGRTYSVKALYYRYLFPLGARQWLEKNIANYDVVHIAKNWSALAYMASTAAVRHRIPFVFSPMGCVTVNSRSRVLKRLYNTFITMPMVHRASACIAVTEEEKTHLVQAGAVPEKVHVIPNGVVLDNFLHRDDAHFRRQHNLGDRKIILFIGRMHPVKGVHLLIDAFEKNRAALGEWVLVLVGPKTAYRQHMKKKVEDLHLTQSVLFLDPLFGTQKSEAYHAAECVAIPSLNDAMTIIAPEAACCAKPVLITNTADFSALARCGGAVEVDPTVEGVAHGLEILTSARCDRVRMGKKGYDYVVNTLLWEHLAHTYIDIFRAAAQSANHTMTPSQMCCASGQHLSERSKTCGL